MARSGVRVRLKGPLFNQTILDDATYKLKPAIQDSITKYAFRAVSRILKSKIKKPTPIYQLLISIIRSDPWRVTDHGGVVYNHWLEGTSDRNFPATRFKGYHAFQRAHELTAKRAGKLAQTKVGQMTRRLGGRVTVSGGGEGGTGD